MSLALDASTPAFAVSGYLGTPSATQQSGSFSPPAGAVIVVTSFAGDSYQADWDATKPTITDSLGTHLTWNLVTAAYSNSLSTPSTRVGLWWAYTAVAQTGMTVTVTDACTGGQYVSYMAVAVTVWTGASTTAPVSAATVSGTTGSETSFSQSITPTLTQSALLLACGADYASAAGAISAGSGFYAADNDGTRSFSQQWQGTSGEPTLTSSLSPVALTASTGTAVTWQYIGFEVIPSGTNATAGHGTSTGVPAAPNPQVSVTLIVL